ncbi:MAG: cell division protein FtsZ [Rickettsia endosymbiont of Labidopullus appendiculatus]|nr:cell division protein FtsZ [Rickettsia endosymbiont of Labidopullus appendiculatus]
MALHLKAPENVILKPIITVFGVGGAGGNAINNMLLAKLQGANFVVANTDAQSLEHSLCDNKIQLGVAITKGLGAGASPEIGALAAEESADEIKGHLEGSNMVFITAGMGGGTGTGASPVVAKIAKELGILTVGVVTKPFHFEGKHRIKTAEQGLLELQRFVDTLIVIPNQNLFRIANENTTFADAFKMADDVLHAGVRGVTDLMIMPGLINLDFADIRTVMSEMGKAMMGTGEASGEDRAVKAAEAAISNPLLDHNSMRGARGVLINITGGADMTLFEVDSAANRIREEVGDSDANIIFGSTFNQELNGVIRVSVVATGIDADQVISNKPQPIESVTSNPASCEQVASDHHDLVETTVLEEIPDFTQYTGEKASLVDSGVQPLNLNVQATSINIPNQPTISSNDAKASLLSRMWNSLKSNTNQNQTQEQIKNHIPPISQKSDVDVDIHDIPAFLRKPK